MATDRDSGAVTMLNPVLINYALLLQFAALALWWFITGDRAQSVYWCGAFICTAGVTFK